MPFLFPYIPGTVKALIFVSVTKERNYYFAFNKAHVHYTLQQNGSQSESMIETSGCVTVFEDLNNFVDMNGSIYR